LNFAPSHAYVTLVGLLHGVTSGSRPAVGVSFENGHVVAVHPVAVPLDNVIFPFPPLKLAYTLFFPIARATSAANTGMMETPLPLVFGA